MSDKMRLTAHNGRAGRDGAYSAKHNDRNFDTTNAKHIDRERSPGNDYWHCYKRYAPEMTFEQVEARFYERHFAQHLEAANQRSIAQRHPERVRSMDDYRASKRTCPEETIMQIGKAGASIDPRKLFYVCMEQVTWEGQRFPNVRILDVAMHVDEAGAPHVHTRKVWVGHDAQGRECVGQSKALAEMGIAPPDPSKDYGRYNNAKITYTAECRAHFLQLCREHGIDIDETPREHSKSGLSLEEYKAQQEIARAEQARHELRDASAKLQYARQELQDCAERLPEARQRLQEAEDRIKPLRGEYEAYRAILRDTDCMALYPPEAKKVLKGLPGKRQEYVEVPKALWEQRWVEASARAGAVRAMEQVDRALQDLKSTDLGRELGELGLHCQQLEQANRQLAQQVEAHKAAAQQAESARISAIDRVQNTLYQLPKDVAQQFINAWNGLDKPAPERVYHHDRDDDMER